MLVSISTRPKPMTLVAVALVAWGATALLRRDIESDAPACALEEGCAPQVTVESAALEGSPPTLSASEACVDVGYLCADLAENEVIQLRRWQSAEGTLVVHVPVPQMANQTAARALQRAAAQGLRAWAGQPFEVLADLRGDRNPHFSVRWTQSLGGSQLGVTRTEWSPRTGLAVVSIELVTHSPFGSQTVDPQQVRLTAAHEMGHALGLSHSGAPHDLMYPTNTATSMSAQDFRTIEVLYRMEDGTRIRR